MKTILIIGVLVGTATLTIAQQHRLDSLHRELTVASNEKIRSEILLQLANYYGFSKVDSAAYFLRQLLRTTSNDSLRIRAFLSLTAIFRYSRPDSTLYYANLGLRLSRSKGFVREEVIIMNDAALAETVVGNFSKALQLSLQVIKISEKNNLPEELAFGQSVLGLVYSQTDSLDRSILIFKKVLNYYYTVDHPYIGGTQAIISEAYADLGQRDSAIFYSELALHSIRPPSYFTIDLVASAYNKLGDFDKSLKYYHLSAHSGELYLAFKANLAIANIHKQMHRQDSALFYGMKALDVANESGSYSNIIEANSFLFDFYNERSPAQALSYARQAIVYKDSLMAMERSMSVNDLISVDEEQRKNEIAAAKKEFQNKLRMNAMLGTMFTLLVVAVILYRGRRQSKNAKRKIEAAYDQLKATQSQLVQSEKMASLGELTAGIAHEIQNPLNFVNNFSEVSNELLSEMKTELSSGNHQAATQIANDVIQNMEKIMHHGKRADGIVKGMLQHSRSSSGTKEPTDINALCDEYVRLAYHGLKAKNQSFKVTIKTDLDETVGKINVVTQDIGRVILNLINNAFYAVSDKATKRTDYEPTVTVSTKKRGEKILIIVKDNGDGIPDNVVDKIFQPFFTTKPTGQGTGLGLSLSYDIVKAHGGELEVETKEGEGCEFVVRLTEHP